MISTKSTRSEVAFADSHNHYRLCHEFVDCALSCGEKEVLTITVMHDAEDGDLEFVRINQKYEDQDKRKAMYNSIMHRAIELFEKLRQI